MSDIGEEIKGPIIQATESAITRVFSRLKDGKITEDEASELVVEVSSIVVDVGAAVANAYAPGSGAVVDIALAPIIQTGALAIYELVDDALEANPDRIDARAARADAAGRTDRAHRLRARAERVRKRQATR